MQALGSRDYEDWYHSSVRFIFWILLLTFLVDWYNSTGIVLGQQINNIVATAII